MLKTTIVVSVIITGLMNAGLLRANEHEVNSERERPFSLPKNTSVSITEGDLRQRIALFAADEFEGRGPATPAGELAADWIAAEMHRIGLEPAGEEGGWFQKVEVIEQTLDEERSSISIITPGRQERSLELGRDLVVWSKRQNEADLSWSASNLVFVGYGIVAPEFGWNDYSGLDVEGKTVVILVNDPGFARRDELFDGEAMTYYGRWTYKFEEAARQGATGAIIVHQEKPASYNWDLVRRSWSGTQADLVRANAGEDRTLFEGWLSIEATKALFDDAGADFEGAYQAASKRNFRPISLGELSISGEMFRSVRRTASRNVLGRIRGTDMPEEHILYGGHWDHLGVSDKPDASGDRIYNGAIDNATGISAILEIAEAMKEARPARSVLFIGFTLEEKGLLGSAYYAAYPMVPLHKTVAGFNIDALIPSGPTNDMVVLGSGASELEDILASHLSRDGRYITPDPFPHFGSFYRSDHISLAKKGVPMLYADEGVDLIDGGTAAGKALKEHYLKELYHQPADNYAESWKLESLRQHAQALFDTGFEIASSDAWPTWYPGNEFEKIRQESLASGKD